MNRRSLLQFLGLAWPASGAFAQASGGRTARLVVPLGPGTVSDLAARLIAPHLSTSLGQNFVVDNKAGGNGVIGVQDVMRAPTDGSAIMLGSVSPLAINVALMKNLPYDPRRDLTPIGGAYTAHHVLAVKASHPARNLAEFIAYAKQRPGKVSIGYSSSLVQAQILAMNKMAGIEILAVPYKATAPTFTDVLGGTLDAALTDLLNAAGQAKAGAIRVLAVSSPKRNPLVPDWPAVAETLPGFDFTSWSALVGPAGMPRETVNRINTALGNAVKQKDVLEKFELSGILPWTTTPDELKAFMEAQATRWIRLARELNIQPE
ncbi:MAG TPA: tripartite tricarboxylate transporter substrate binding protein [Ramlibacter sp.]|nr:tripartite tricarboxylate transporter substrate binding protein [Ramlibacter sp.]